MGEGWSWGAAAQLLIGGVGGALYTMVFGRRWLLRIESEYSGSRRALHALLLTAAGFANMRLLWLWAKVPYLPLMLVGAFFWIVLAWTGLTVLVWMPFGGYTRRAK